MRGNLRLLADSGKRIANLGTQGSLVIVVLLIVLPAALTSVPVAVVCASALVITTMALIVGLGRTGSGLLVVAFATAPLDSLRAIGPFSVALSDLLFVAGFVVLIPRLAATTLHLPKAFLFGGIGLLTVGSLSALASDQPGYNSYRLVFVASGVVLLPVLLTWWQPGHRTTIAAAAAYTFGNTVSVAACLFEDPYMEGRYAGLTTHPNVFGLCQTLSIALAPFLLEAAPRRYRWIVCVGFLISAYGIWISGSRAALLSAVALTLLYPLFRRSIPAALVVAALCLPAIVVVNRVAQNPDPSNALGRLLGGAPQSDEYRRAGAQTAVDQFLSHPLIGDGWESVWLVHNVYLQVAAAIGMLGLVCFLFVLASILRPLIAVPRPYGLLAAPGLAAAMLGAVDPALGNRYIWCVVALALSADRLVALAEEPSDQVSNSAVAPRPEPSVASNKETSVASNKEMGVALWGRSH